MSTCQCEHSIDVADFKFVNEMWEELTRARRKFPDEEFKIGGADWLRVLMEEVGEASREINEAADAGKPLDVRALRAEIAQIAAVCARWAAGLEVGGGR